MPLYAYKCESCGFSKDVLQKISDAPLTACPACGADAFRKQVTAAGFQLKGSGWYVTDFRDGAKPSGSKADGDGKPAETAKPEAASPAKADAPAAAPAPAPAAPPPAPSSGS
ncbi:FmdB family zinc ribbon protein [Xylophilus sp. ASV27]|uniref:FmdB family zinc ribbon protein n=1 Tax=Xylophilus sp. ASV27 TaxID=2795129 RepID=UPI0018EE44FE|nr:FmdB family zinc ribbon protein [Xylophilus sp. ASV27]